MNYTHKLSVVIPIHDMKNGDKFLWDSINALMDQTYQDFELVITRQGTMAQNTNAGIKRARGEYIKILYLDDRLAHKNALQDIVDALTDDTKWLITGCDDNMKPYWTPNIESGNNKLGSPSVLTIKNDNLLLFDRTMTWLLDCDYYKRMYTRYGEPTILEGEHVIIGKGSHQMTHILTDDQKKAEEAYMKLKYA